MPYSCSAVLDMYATLRLSTIKTIVQSNGRHSVWTFPLLVVLVALAHARPHHTHKSIQYLNSPPATLQPECLRIGLHSTFARMMSVSHFNCGTFTQSGIECERAHTHTSQLNIWNGSHKQRPHSFVSFSNRFSSIWSGGSLAYGGRQWRWLLMCNLAWVNWTPTEMGNVLRSVRMEEMQFCSIYGVNRENEQQEKKNALHF